MNRIAPTGVLEVPTTDRLLNFSSELVHSLNLRVVSLELVKIEVLEHLKVVLFRRSERTENERLLARGIVQSTGRRRGTADGRISRPNRRRCRFCWFFQLLQLD